jgi:serine protease AprX
MRSLKATLPTLQKKLTTFFALAAFVLLAASGASAQDATFGPGLESTLDALAPGETTTVVVTFEGEGALTDAQVGAVEALGVTQGITFQSLPIMGAVATPAQVYDIAALDGVRSVWPNKELTYYNNGATEITGVDKLQSDPDLRTARGAPRAGQGITAMINDSGIDGTHRDLEFGSHVVENVQALTNLNAVSGLLPVTFTEGMPNTDTNSGHGTHCAGIFGATGAQSNGKYAGVAPAADIVGYGSGGVILILDAIGGFDYAVTHQFSFESPIRIISNSFGSSGAFDEDDPLNVATYQTYKRNINVVFAAGNSGPGENSHNPYAKAPWVVSVGAGTKSGTLAEFSSRGTEGQSREFQTDDGRTWVTRDELTVTGPGVDIISTRASTNLSANGGEGDVDAIETAFLPYYTQISGTSMSTPHVAGIVALILQANPQLDPLEVKSLLEETATNMPGREKWEAGTGYVNAYAAVVEALGQNDFGATVNDARNFNSSALVSDAGSEDFSLFFSPVGEREVKTFEVAGDISRVKARAVVPDNTVALVLEDPEGNTYGSAISLPLIGSTISVGAPGQEGTWKLYISGIGSVSGVATDPLGVTNGTSAPGTVSGALSFEKTAGFAGLSDIAGHPAEGFIKAAVSDRLVDGFADGTYRPDAALTRAQLSQYLVQGAGVRQSLPLDGSASSFSDVSTAQAPFVEAVTAKGAALMDRQQFDAGVVRASGSSFDPEGAVTRARLAYSLVQSYGFEDIAADYTGDVVATYNGERIPLDDQAAIPEGLRGYVQLALDLGLLNAYFDVEQGEFDLEPTITATFEPNTDVTRGAYAVAATRYFGNYGNVTEADVSGGDEDSSSSTLAASSETKVGNASFTLSQNYPNPARGATTVSFTLPESETVSLVVYDVLGRRVRSLANQKMSAGTHQMRVSVASLASGTYLYRLKAGDRTQTRQMIVVR